MFICVDKLKCTLYNIKSRLAITLAKADLQGVCGCSSMVEHQPSKLIAWVRFPSPAPKKFKGLVNKFLLQIEAKESDPRGLERQTQSVQKGLNDRFVAKVGVRYHEQSEWWTTWLARAAGVIPITRSIKFQRFD